MIRMKYLSELKNKGQLKRPKGEIHIIKDRCKGCGFCVEFCPKQVLIISDGFNRKGYHPPEVANPDDCINCRLCQILCPDFAIWVSDSGEVEVSSEREVAAKKGVA